MQYCAIFFNEAVAATKYQKLKFIQKVTEDANILFLHFYDINNKTCICLQPLFLILTFFDLEKIQKNSKNTLEKRINIIKSLKFLFGQ